MTRQEETAEQKEGLRALYAGRRGRIAARLREEGLAALLIEDTEGRRDPSLRYLSGQPSDALLVITEDDRSLLVAWDLNMARSRASADEILAYSDFERLPERALGGALAAGATLVLPR